MANKSQNFMNAILNQLFHLFLIPSHQIATTTAQSWTLKGRRHKSGWITEGNEHKNG